MRILNLDGSEICKMLSFARSRGEMAAQVAIEHGPTLGTRETDVLFEDDSGHQFRGSVRGTRVCPTGAIVSAKLQDLGAVATSHPKP